MFAYFVKKDTNCQKEDVFTDRMKIGFELFHFPPKTDSTFTRNRYYFIVFVRSRDSFRHLFRRTSIYAAAMRMATVFSPPPMTQTSQCSL